MDTVGVTIELSTDGPKRFSALKIPAQVTAAVTNFENPATGFERFDGAKRLNDWNVWNRLSSKTRGWSTVTMESRNF
jgi:hypothetical protein